MFKSDVLLLAALYFGGTIDAAITSNYTQAILSSGTGKRASLLSSRHN
jgi:beta-glucosidase